MEKCELYISRLQGAPDGRVVCISIRQGRNCIAQIELPIEDFALAVMGQGAIPANLTKRQRLSKPAIELGPEDNLIED